MPVRLTSRLIDALRPGSTRTQIFDELVPGLMLRVSPSGAKSWSVLYRHRKRVRRLTLGSAAVVSLADARERAREALRDTSKGADPATRKKSDRSAATMASLVDAYLTQHAKRKKRSWKADDRIARTEILSVWRHRAVRDIKRTDILELVDAIAERGVPIMANRTTALVSKLFSFAMNQGWIDASPAVRIPRPAPEHARDRVLTEDEIRVAWKQFGALDPAMAAFYKLRLLTAQRGQEVNTMRWQDLDLTAGWWTIQAEQSKNKLAHRVPLATSVVTLLKSLVPDSGTKATSIYVLEGARGKRQQSEAAATFTVSDFRGHDLRRTAAAMMTSGGVPRLVVGKILNHVEKGVTAIYDRSSYDAEKREALDWWARRLQAILDRKRRRTVPFEAARR
jgi:integrase